MRIEIIGTNYTPSNQLKELIGKKAAKLDRFFSDGDTAKFVCSQVKGKDRFTLEATIYFNGNMLRVEETSDNIYDNVYVIIPKIERMIRKYRTKLDKKLKEDAFSEKFLASEDVPLKPEVVKNKKFGLKPLSKDDAISELELLDHDFYLYLNENTGMVNVAYKRKDGNVGIIECVY